jgi:hypothetical protein
MRPLTWEEFNGREEPKDTMNGLRLPAGGEDLIVDVNAKTFRGDAVPDKDRLKRLQALLAERHYVVPAGNHHADMNVLSNDGDQFGAGGLHGGIPIHTDAALELLALRI